MTQTERTASSKRFGVVPEASSGIGRELAKVFVDEGFDVLIAAEDDGIEEAAAELRAGGAQVWSCRADLATYAGVEQLAEAISFAENDLEAELRTIDLNCSSTVHLAKRVLPR